MTALSGSELGWPDAAGEGQEEGLGWPPAPGAAPPVPLPPDPAAAPASDVAAGETGDGTATPGAGGGPVPTPAPAPDLDPTPAPGAGLVLPTPGPDSPDEPGRAPLPAPVSRETGSPRSPEPAGIAPPTRTRVLAVANQKGGVGKTTSAVNLAAALALQGASVLVLDLDPQGNASTALGIDHHAEVPSVYDVLIEGAPLATVVRPVAAVPGLECAPATIDLAGAEIELVSLVARESRLLRALRAYRQTRAQAGQRRLDYVLIDCPPSLGLLTVNALVAAGEVLIPIQCEYYALEGLGQLTRNVEMVRSHLNPDLHVSTILLTMYDARTRLAAQVAGEVRRHFAGMVLATTIPRSVRVSEAPSYGQTVLTYDPGSTGALCYREAARELARGSGDPAEAGEAAEPAEAGEAAEPAEAGEAAEPGEPGEPGAEMERVDAGGPVDVVLPRDWELQR